LINIISSFIIAALLLCKKIYYYTSGKDIMIGISQNGEIGMHIRWDTLGNFI
jgi:hypothetical protein